MKQQINAANAPAAIGPYCHAIEMEGFVFTSGQLGIDPATGKLCEGVEAQARQAFTNETDRHHDYSPIANRLNV